MGERGRKPHCRAPSFKVLLGMTALAAKGWPLIGSIRPRQTSDSGGSWLNYLGLSSPLKEGGVMTKVNAYSQAEAWRLQ